jgi:ectoine hydroxylase-related dioxygenase (phytanoyl-CoA dioxygenase family)
VHEKTVRARHQRPEKTQPHVPFHQDCSFLGTKPVWVNCWIPLTPCGTGAPGLELYAVHTREIFQTAEPATSANYPISAIAADTLARALAPTQPWAPNFAPGDAVLFDSFVPHRTASTPAMTASRISLEVRFGPV